MFFYACMYSTCILCVLHVKIRRFAHFFDNVCTHETLLLSCDIVYQFKKYHNLGYVDKRNIAEGWPQYV